MLVVLAAVDARVHGPVRGARARLRRFVFGDMCSSPRTYRTCPEKTNRIGRLHEGWTAASQDFNPPYGGVDPETEIPSCSTL